MNFLLILPVVIPVVLSLVWRWLRLEGKKLSIATLATVAGSAALAAACALIPGTGQISLRWTDMLTFSLRVDGISRIFLLLVAVVWPCVALYATEYLEHGPKPERFYLFYTITQGILHALAMRSNMEVRGFII